MDESHKNKICEKVMPERGRQEFLCGNQDSFFHPSVGSNSALSRETQEALEDLGEVLKSIKKRMYNEGYQVIDGMVRKIEAPNILWIKQK
jgi:hypothetical protein